MNPRTILTFWVCAVAGCTTSAPSAPLPDESTRRPVNSASAIELQSCQANLANTKRLVEEASRNAEQAAGSLPQNARRYEPVAKLGEEKASSQRANTVYIIFFKYARHEVRLFQEDIDRLVADARAATSIQIRGRTDASRDKAFDTKLAARRAGAVLAPLVSRGVDPSRIRVTYQGQSDGIAPNTDEKTRVLNRRAEIEIYRAPAQTLVLGARAMS